MTERPSGVPIIESYNEKAKRSCCRYVGKRRTQSHKLERLL